MANLIGTFKLESEENYKEYLLSLGLGEEKAVKFASASTKENAVISAVDAKSVTAQYAGNSVVFPLNKELEHVVKSGDKIWTTAIVNDANSITFKTKFSEDGSISEEKVLKLADGVLTITSTNSKGGKAVRTYKKI